MGGLADLKLRLTTSKYLLVAEADYHAAELQRRLRYCRAVASNQLAQELQCQQLRVLFEHVLQRGIHQLGDSSRKLAKVLRVVNGEVYQLPQAVASCLIVGLSQLLEELFVVYVV